MHLRPALGLLAFFAFLSLSAQAEPAALPQYREWIGQMKQSERGPFSKVVWFCKDGSVQEPVAFACREHGGGYQHGLWNERTRELRAQGYKIANFLAGVQAGQLIDQEDFRDTLGQVLVEKYLIGIDDGWILRRAMYYRGAIQDEDERAGARALLQAMAARPHWLQAGYPALRTAAKVLPHGANSASVQTVRQLSASLSDRDEAFHALRSKIHGAPDAGDAQRVREYASRQAAAGLSDEYAQLADEIDLVYQGEALDLVLRERAEAYNLAPWLQQMLFQAADDFASRPAPAARFKLTARLMVDLREALPRVNAPFVRVQLLDLGIRAELEHFRAATELRPQLESLSRRELVSLLLDAAGAAHGAGLINRRLMDGVGEAANMVGTTELSLDAYMGRLTYLARAPAWGMQALRMPFQESMDTLAELEPNAQLFIQDQLRASPLLFYADVLDLLMRDANRQLGVKHHLFGEDIGFGLTALNPGMARGVLHAGPGQGSRQSYAANGIYLLPETIAELPPIAGILTAGEGNPLSHIQLLARNLGIPNVVVSETLTETLASRDQQAVVLAVSPGGLVELSADGSQWDPYFPSGSETRQAFIHPDLGKLDLGVQELLPLSRLRASDSGRTVGPKAAKLGELRAHYPEAVARGLAIPFGVFNACVLQQPWHGDPTGQTSVFAWMTEQYRQLDQLAAGSEERASATEAFRAELYDIVVNTQIPPGLQDSLRQAMDETFAPGGRVGVFIRSDTNVEDLPGFTGAGLNLTLPNVVGFEALLQGIQRVWASPFTARAFAWRQSLMTRPEHVYTSILLLESVPVDKSGVLVTQDIDSGNPAVLSVAVNEGPGGAVDGQAAESLRIALDGSRTIVLATATAPWRRVLLPEGGVGKVPSTGSDTVLEPQEIARLIEFSRHLPETFPPIVDESGKPAPADVEFGFQDGELRLFQIRPFLDNPAARSSEYLHRMDASLQSHGERSIDLDGRAEP